MADFIEKKEEPVEETTEKTKEPEKIKIGEKEYTQEDLAGLVEMGELGREIETKQNTKLGRVFPEYTKTTQELKALKEEKVKWEAERASLKTTSGQELNEEEIAKQAREQAKKIGLALTEDIESKVIDTVMKTLEAKELVEDTKSYEKEIDGKDGRPVFECKEILEYMEETGIKFPLKAYKDKYEKELDAWKEEQIRKAKPKGLVTEETGGGGLKEPLPTKIDKSNFESTVREALEGLSG